MGAGLEARTTKKLCGWAVVGVARRLLMDGVECSFF
jgi:hypothetical protein